MTEAMTVRWADTGTAVVSYEQPQGAGTGRVGACTWGWVVSGVLVGAGGQDETKEAGMDETAEQLRALSVWIDDSNAHRDPEAVTWGRLAKITEEAGEVIEAFIGATDQNPRKGRTHDGTDVIAELHDVALTALCAVEHMTNNGGQSMALFADHVAKVAARAGVSRG